MSSMENQQTELKVILEKYDANTQKLYFDVLKMFSEKASRTTKTAIRNNILDIVKEETK